MVGSREVHWSPHVLNGSVWRELLVARSGVYLQEAAKLRDHYWSGVYSEEAAKLMDPHWSGAYSEQVARSMDPR